MRGAGDDGGTGEAGRVVPLLQAGRPRPPDSPAAPDRPPSADPGPVQRRDRFTYDGEADAYICPEGETLSHVGIDAKSQANVYRASPNRGRGCPQKKACTRGRAQALGELA